MSVQLSQGDRQFLPDYMFSDVKNVYILFIVLQGTVFQNCR